MAQACAPADAAHPPVTVRALRLPILRARGLNLAEILLTKLSAAGSEAGTSPSERIRALTPGKAAAGRSTPGTQAAQEDEVLTHVRSLAELKQVSAFACCVGLWQCIVCSSASVPQLDVFGCSACRQALWL